MPNEDEAIDYHQPTAGDLPSIVSFLSSASLSIGGAVNPRLYDALYRDGLTNRRLTTVIAVHGTELAGIVTSIVQPSDYWKRFLIRRPFFLFEVLQRRIGQSIYARRSVYANAVLQPLPDAPSIVGTSSYSWSQSDKHIAKVLFIGVAPKFRRKHLARDLYMRLFENLTLQGMFRIDARIEKDNLGSIKLHHSVGYELYREGAHILAVRCLIPNVLSDCRDDESESHAVP